MAIEGNGSLDVNARYQPRTSMFLAAVLHAKSERAPARVRNMSANGALLESPVTPGPGTEIHLMRGVLVAQGTVVWSSNNRCGVRFSSEVSVKEWLASPATKPQQQRVDDVVALVRAGGSDVQFPSSAKAQARSHEQLVDDLRAVMRLMQDLEDNLAASNETLERHAMKLQNMDIAMQMLRAVSAELTPGNDNGAEGIARLQDLRISCSQALAS